MANVVRFVLSTARDVHVPGVGQFHNGVLDIDANNMAALTRARYLLQPYQAVELGVVNSAAPPPELPPDILDVEILPDPYPQYLDEVEADAKYVPFWKPGKFVAAGAIRMAADGTTIRRNTSGTTRVSFDETEASLWTVVSSGGDGVGLSEDDVAAGLAESGNPIGDAARAAFGLLVKVAGGGIDPTGAADSTAAIQALLDAATPGTCLLFPAGTYRITAPLSVGSGVTLLSWHGAVIKLDGATAARMLVNKDWAAGNTDITLDGLTFDGSRSTSGDGRTLGTNHAIYLNKVTRLALRNITVRNPLAFGALIHTCSEVFVSNYRSESALINQDGLHFFDSHEVVINGVYGTAGDDLLGISADLGDTRNFAVSNVIGSSAGGSVVRINQTDRSVTAGETRTIERLTFRNIIGRGTANKGFSINDVHASSTVRAIDVSGAVFANTARSALDIVRCTDSSFDVTAINCGTGAGVTAFFTLQPIYVATRVDRCRFNLRVRGVTDGYDAIRITAGDNLVIHPEVFYPTAGFSNAQMCVWLGNVTDSIVSDGFTDGGNRGVQVGTSTIAASRVTVTGMTIENQAGFAIAEGTVAGANNNRFVDNVVKTGGISKSGAATLVERNQGYVTEARGTATIASGGTSITVAHGLATTPTNVQLTGRHAETASAHLASAPDVTNIQIGVAAATTAARTVDWIARV